MEPVVFANVEEYLAGGGQSNAELMRPYLNKAGRIVVALNGKEVPYVRQNASTVLRQSEWEQIDAAVVRTVQAPNTAVADFAAYGLSYPLEGGIGTLLSGYTQLGDMSDANISMDGVTKGDEDRPEFNDTYIPVPFIHKDFTLSSRVLQASRNSGTSIDTTQIAEATRLVNKAIEYMIFNGSTKKLKGYSIYGLLTAPNATSQTAAAWGGGDFGTAGNAYKTLAGMLASLSAKGFRGPYGVYISATQYGQLLNLLSTTSGKSELSVILEGLPDIKFIRPQPITNVADGVVVMFQLSRDVIDMPIAQNVTPVEWSIMGPFLTKYRVLGCLTVRAKTDANNVTGINIATSA